MLALAWAWSGSPWPGPRRSLVQFVLKAVTRDDELGGPASRARGALDGRSEVTLRRARRYNAEALVGGVGHTYLVDVGTGAGRGPAPVGRAQLRRHPSSAVIERCGLGDSGYCQK